MIHGHLSPEARLKGRKFLVTRGNSILRCTCCACELNVFTRTKYQQRVIDVEMGSFTPPTHPPPPGFWHERRNGERMQTFPEQT